MKFMLFDLELVENEIEGLPIDESVKRTLSKLVSDYRENEECSTLTTIKMLNNLIRMDLVNDEFLSTELAKFLFVNRYDDTLITITEACSLIGSSKQWISQLVKEEKIRFRKDGRSVYVSKKDVLNMKK